MDSFRNTTESIVDDAIDGLVHASGGTLQRLPRGGHARVVLRCPLDKTKVSVISGGGSGHEPLHAGLVGPGLLTAAVCGGVFASPSADAVLEAIVATTDEAGCLLIVKNYTGDTLNFGLAAERAKLLGYNVQTVTVADDVGRGRDPRPRGIAGVVFVHKVAGHFADAGGSLTDVAKAADAAARRTFSIGIARGTCHVPGSERTPRLQPGEAEVALGIHGEAGREVVKLESAAQVVGIAADSLADLVHPSVRYAVLFNNLGGLPGAEALVLFSEFAKTKVFEQVDLVMGPCTLVTALDMPGFSISLVELDPAFADALKAPVEVRVWPGFVPARTEQAHAAPAVTGLSRDKPEPSAEPLTRAVLEAICTACEGMQSELDALDAAAGDGDAGTTLAAGARALQSELDDLPLATPGPLLASVGEITARAMGGSSGALLGILCAGMSSAFDGGSSWPEALNAGVNALMKAGRTQPGDRTCVDALRPALDVLIKGGELVEATAAARRGVERTTKMKPLAGRAMYVPREVTRGVVDAGAEAVAGIFKAVAEAVAKYRNG